MYSLQTSDISVLRRIFSRQKNTAQLQLQAEDSSAPVQQNTLKSRLKKHFVTCSAALALAGGMQEANAAVVGWTDANLVIPATIDGTYINVETKTTGTAGSSVPGWDINPYSATSLTWFNATGTGMMRYPGVTTGSAGNLAPGTLVGPSGSFGSGAVTVGVAPGNWVLNASNYFGFRFVAADGLTHYGYGRMDVGASITIRTLVEIYYEDQAGVGIVIGGGPSCTAPTLSGSVTQVTCHGGSSGAIDLTATGGLPTPYNYVWSNGITNSDISNLSAGSYTVTVTTDGGGCSATSSFTVTQPVAVAAGITNNTGQTALPCSTKSISVTATGGTSYAWSGGSSTAAADNTLTTAGTYTVTVTDAAGCTGTTSLTVTDSPAVMANITNNTGSTQLTCDVTSISVTATGGTSYAWSGGSLPSAATTSLTSAGTYTVTVTDASGCTGTASVTITDSSNSKPATPMVSVITQPSCNPPIGGKCGLSGLPAGSWTIEQEGSENTISYTGSGNSYEISNLTPGVYRFRVINANGCSSAYTNPFGAVIVLH